FNLRSGRYFSMQEANGATNVAIIGVKIKEQLFPGEEAENKEIKIKGLKFTVIGVFEEEGESLLDTPSNDELVVVPYLGFKKMFYTGSRWGIESIIVVKGFDDDPDLQNLRGELTGLMRRL